MGNDNFITFLFKTIKNTLFMSVFTITTIIIFFVTILEYVRIIGS